MYTFPDGRKKCDALVTFVKVESVASACLQYNNVSLGGGYTLQVSPASFKDSGQQQQQEDMGQVQISQVDGTVSVHVQEHQGGLGYSNNEETIGQKPIAQNQKQVFLSSVSASSSLSVPSNSSMGRSEASSPALSEEQLLCAALPPESEAYDYPIALLQNVYDGNKYESLDVEFFIELEADMLEACCSCGRVRRLMTPDHPLLRGTVAVTFEEAVGARECFVKLNRRRFDARELTVRLINRPQRPQLPIIPSEARPLINSTPAPASAPAPVHPSSNSVILSSSVVQTRAPSEDMIAADNSAMTMNFLTSIQKSYGKGSDDPGAKKTGDDDDKTATAAANDTEDFLNSLL
mmetsp:Transcript_11702/g.21745  ORF Transcript_11702/g.21745 Transcript_11702/m.21745 type:complete len:349 (+) Transcript_11702:794-1840(+)